MIFHKRDNKEVRVSMTEWKGQDRLDIREWYQDNFGEWKPSQKGCQIPKNEIASFIGAIKEICGWED